MTSPQHILVFKYPSRDRVKDKFTKIWGKRGKKEKTGKEERGELREEEKLGEQGDEKEHGEQGEQ